MTPSGIGPAVSMITCLFMQMYSGFKNKGGAAGFFFRLQETLLSSTSVWPVAESELAAAA